MPADVDVGLGSISTSLVDAGRRRPRCNTGVVFRYEHLAVAHMPNRSVSVRSNRAAVVMGSSEGTITAW
jgi:hypothetical protein